MEASPSSPSGEEEEATFGRKVKSFARYVQTFWAFCVLQVFPEGASCDDKIQNYLYKFAVFVRFCNLLIINVLQIAPESLKNTAAVISKSIKYLYIIV